jgi:beta-fructofuranosidase
MPRDDHRSCVFDNTEEHWRLAFHMMPPGGVGSLNDPNGCCQFKGIYHMFHQYQPDFPNMYPRAWGHAWSKDLIHWHHTGLSIHEDSPFDYHGAFSGCSLIEDEGQTMRLFYTGNFKEPGKHDFIHEGRWASQITTTTHDGIHFTPKRVVLLPQDYPDYVSCHVRDPKVWIRDNGDGHPFRMLLGARDSCDNGFIMVYNSEDKLHWKLHSVIRSAQHFGYMWECPDRMDFEDTYGKRHEFLAFCPQRNRREAKIYENNHLSGYIPLSGDLLNTSIISEDKFIRWDNGFDFYAPQTFVDDQGRSIMFGWMGLPDTPYLSRLPGLGFWQCITVPRLITMEDDGLLCAYPVPELERLRGNKAKHLKDSLIFSDHHADICIEEVKGNLKLTLDDALEIFYESGIAGLRFIDTRVSGGRELRSCSVDHVSSVRVLIDGSTVEVFFNKGKTNFTSRWFPVANHLHIKIKGNYEEAQGWLMGDGMSDVRENKEAARKARAGIQGI